MLKSHDIVVICKMISYKESGDTKFGYQNLSDDLYLSLGECHNSIKRLSQSMLISKNILNKYIPIQKNVLEVFIYGVKYFFPAEIKQIDRGIGTSLSAKPFKNMFNSDYHFVWPYYKGDIKGQVIEPLSKKCVEACLKDPILYKYLSVLDMLRLGKAREIKFAKDFLKKELS